VTGSNLWLPLELGLAQTGHRLHSVERGLDARRQPSVLDLVLKARLDADCLIDAETLKPNSAVLIREQTATCASLARLLSGHSDWIGTAQNLDAPDGPCCRSGAPVG